jgi:hypothetical protein
MAIFAGSLLITHPARSAGIDTLRPSATLAQPLTRDDLRRLYPYLSDDDFGAKFDAATDPFRFLRTFIPYFYQVIRNNPPPELITLMTNSAGWCVGDAHPENFGVLVADNGEAIFTINDVDDAGPCPLLADAIRYFVSIKLFAPNADLRPLLDQYKLALLGRPQPFSLQVQKLLNYAKGHTEPSNIETTVDYRIARKTEERDLTPEETAAIQSVFDSWYPGSRVIDGAAFKKVSGGSGGLQRYRTLIALSTPVGFAPVVQMIEFKGIQPPGIWPLAIGTIEATPLRYARTLKFEQGYYSSAFYSVVNLMGQEMLTRPRRAGNIGVVLKDLTKGQDLLAVLLDEATVLGSIHARTAANPQVYTNLAATLDNATWIRTINSYSDIIKAAFLATRQPVAHDLYRSY